MQSLRARHNQSGNTVEPSAPRAPDHALPSPTHVHQQARNPAALGLDETSRDRPPASPQRSHISRCRARTAGFRRSRFPAPLPPASFALRHPARAPGPRPARRVQQPHHPPGCLTTRASCLAKNACRHRPPFPGGPAISILVSCRAARRTASGPQSWQPWIARQGSESRP